MNVRVLWKWSVLGAVLLCVGWSSQAQQSGWQSVVIAEAGFSSGDLVYNSDLAVAPDGTAYVVWADLGGDIMLSVVPPGETLRPGSPINVSQGAGGDWPVAPAVSLGGGRLCVVWEGWDDLGGDIFIRCSDDGAQTWLSPPVRVAETDAASGQHELGGEWDGNVDVFVDPKRLSTSHGLRISPSSSGASLLTARRSQRSRRSLRRLTFCAGLTGPKDLVARSTWRTL
jgi:hypothetical protein